jgi:hypothetical protein
MLPLLAVESAVISSLEINDHVLQVLDCKQRLRPSLLLCQFTARERIRRTWQNILQSALWIMRANVTKKERNDKRYLPAVGGGSQNARATVPNRSIASGGAGNDKLFGSDDRASDAMSALWRALR